MKRQLTAQCHWSFNCLAISLLLLLVSASAVLAETDTSRLTLQLTAEEQAWLKDHPNIRFAPAPNYPPVEFFDEEGVYRGITSDFIDHIKEKFGYSFNIVRLKNWSEVIAQTKLRKVDMWGAAAKTEERETYMRFTEPYIRLPAVIIVRDEMRGSLEMPDLKGRQVVVIKDYATHRYIEENFPELDLVPVPDIETGLRMVSFGAADAIVATNASAIYYIEKNGLTNLRVAGESGYEWHLRFAVRSDWPELASIIQKGLDSIPEDKKREIYRRWVSLKGGWQPSREQIVVAAAIAGALLLLWVLAWNRVLRRKVQESTQALASTLRQQSLILQNAQAGIAYIKDQKICWANPLLADLSGLDKDSLIGKSTRDFYLTDSDYQEIGEAYAAVLARGEPFETEIKLRRGKEGSYWCNLVGQAVDPDQPGEGSIWLFNDITAQKELERSLTIQATTDPLTGLANRRSFLKQLDRELARHKRVGEPATVIMADIDHFKKINDTYGHATGDDVLRHFADLSRQSLRSADLLGRLGGEEFGILLPATDVAEASELAERYRQLIANNPAKTDQGDISFTISMGISQLDSGDDSPDFVLERADEGLYRAKEGGRNRFEFNLLAEQD
jgi:diguanylate cyclase (GGDEF)-like protein/PAS domain S-box-containing protein